MIINKMQCIELGKNYSSMMTPPTTLPHIVTDVYSGHLKLLHIH